MPLLGCFAAQAGVPIVRLQGCADHREVLVRQTVHLEGAHPGRTGVATDTDGLGKLPRSQIREVKA